MRQSMLFAILAFGATAVQLELGDNDPIADEITGLVTATEDGRDKIIKYWRNMT